MKILLALAAPCAPGLVQDAEPVPVPVDRMHLPLDRLLDQDHACASSTRTAETSRSAVPITPGR
jgi:hypothetical protein